MVIRFASGSHDNTVRLWGVHTGIAGPVLSGHVRAVKCVKYSPSGHRLASFGSMDNTVRLWAVDSGQCLVVISGFLELVSCVAWRPTPDETSPDENHIITGCHDKSVRMWQVTKTENHYQVQLQWSSTQDSLILSNTSIQGVKGLSRTNIQLLEQRGAIGKPAPPLGRTLATVVSAASKFKKLKNGKTTMSLSATPVQQLES